jgi:uncharacterized protein YndB with AHSA1/START domain
MTVTDIRKDVEALTLTVTSRFTTTPSRLWQIWADPRQLERWWGPPTFPATFVDHDFREGGTVTYFMTGPDGEKYSGWWRIKLIEIEKRLDFQDGFSDDTGSPNLDMPVTFTSMTMKPVGDDITEMTSITTFDSVAAMEQLVEMGMIEGFISALSQVTELLTT